MRSSRESAPTGPEPDLWEHRNKAFHEALIAGFDSTWSKYLLSILYRHAERYRNIKTSFAPPLTARKRAPPWRWKPMCG